MPTTQLTDYGMVGALLMVIYWGLYFATKMVLAKKGAGKRTCMDPIMRQRVKEIHDYTEDFKSQIAHGDLGCAWKGRDEVRDLMEIMRSNVSATEALTVELRASRMNGR